jgi:hypothetical protein
VVKLMSDATSTDSAWDRRRWLVLGVISLAQLMVVLDSRHSSDNIRDVR